MALPHELSFEPPAEEISPLLVRVAALTDKLMLSAPGGTGINLPANYYRECLTQAKMIGPDEYVSQRRLLRWAESVAQSDFNQLFSGEEDGGSVSWLTEMIRPGRQPSVPTLKHLAFQALISLSAPSPISKVSWDGTGPRHEHASRDAAYAQRVKEYVRHRRDSGLRASMTETLRETGTKYAYRRWPLHFPKLTQELDRLKLLS
jgi:hypothetical protein